VSVSERIKERAPAVSGRLRRFFANLGMWSRALIRPPRVSATTASALPGWRLILAAVMLLAFAAASTVLFDAWAVGLVRHRPAWVEATFQFITVFGRSGTLLIPLALMLIVLAAVGSPSLSRMSRGVVAALAVRCGFAFLAISVPGLFTTLTKHLVGRVRPYASPHDDPLTFVPFVWRSIYASMPSGHATFAVAAALVIGWLWPRMRELVWLCAVMIALSRIVLTSHYVSDVIIGALIGAAGALLVRYWFAARQLGFAITHEGTIRTFPGPSLRRIKRVAGEVAGQ
jgi:membrane-associated phospholipid phosphatase